MACSVMNEYKLTMSDGTSRTILAERIRRMAEGFVFESQGEEPVVIPRVKVKAWDGPEPLHDLSNSDEEDRADLRK